MYSETATHARVSADIVSSSSCLTQAKYTRPYARVVALVIQHRLGGGRHANALLARTCVLWRFGGIAPKISYECCESASEKEDGAA